MKDERIVILHNIRSAHNVGSIFRTADAVGVTKLYLAGYTPLPTDRFGRPQKEIAKTALGAEKSVAWEHANDTATLIEQLTREGVKTIALEQAKNSVDFRTVTPYAHTAVLLGEEVHGISPEILELCDHIAEIPMRGTKESLNVSVAAGIALFQLFQ